MFFSDVKKILKAVSLFIYVYFIGTGILHGPLPHTRVQHSTAQASLKCLTLDRPLNKLNKKYTQNRTQ